MYEQDGSRHPQRRPSASSGPIPIETQEKLLKVVMQRQGALSLRVGALFLLPLLALPWINQSQPNAFMNSRLLGFSVTWLILGICIFPLTWLVSAYFVHNLDSDRGGSVPCWAAQILPETWQQAHHRRSGYA